MEGRRGEPDDSKCSPWEPHCIGVHMLRAIAKGGGKAKRGRRRGDGFGLEYGNRGTRFTPTYTYLSNRELERWVWIPPNRLEILI